MKNPNYVEQILSNLINAGKQRLQVISDFDRTISLVSFEGKECPTSNGVLESSQFVTPEIREKVMTLFFFFFFSSFKLNTITFVLKFQFKELRDFYLPIEHDPHLTREQKLPHMIDWWRKSFDLVISTGITRQNLVDIVRHSTTHLKEGCLWFFYTLERCDVPLLIFSAGLGDMIQEWLAQDCGQFKNIKIVSNFMSFNGETKKITGFQGNN